MSLIVNGTTIPTDKAFITNGKPVMKVVANGVTVWLASAYNNTLGKETYVQTVPTGHPATVAAVSAYVLSITVYHQDHIPIPQVKPGYQFTGTDGNTYKIGALMEGAAGAKQKYRLDAV